ncbi:NAD(P)H-hydrate epimerase [Ruania halotolerans]|uniref:NAD(P)H-hydrate epimerase n=1 Tax=Ruania halotolerans TaxID=2897773 RepID=UPI001E5F03C6|nr:NAD(P)H-hydrate epimerase [Ruania halotolerans]UFU05708.1 NAD(P)H-hydrate epimerase [Ruania halotolerans]
MINGYDAEAVRAAEAPALAAGVPLMRWAAQAVAATVREVLAGGGIRARSGRVLVLAGGGNNGGDGLHAAADLAGRGVAVTALLARDRVHPGGLDRARRAGVRLLPVTTPDQLAAPGWREAARHAHVWVDALAGIGVRGGLRGHSAALVTALNQLRQDGAPAVVAVDIPSGIDAGTGRLNGPVLSADHTVTMGAAKAGVLLPPAALRAGTVHTCPLGLEDAFATQVPAVARLTAADVATEWPVPQSTDHKYSRGVLGVVAGSPAYPGAGVLTTGAAIATGCGMVRYLGATEVAARVLDHYPEAVTATGRVQAMVVGPGITGQDETARVEQALLTAIEAAPTGEPIAVVWDAGALDLLPRLEHMLRGTRSVLTPHAGELAGLLGSYGHPTERADVEAEPAAWAALAAELTGAVVLLKGPVTVIAQPDGVLFSCADGSPWLATAGSGDVLAGALGALAATSDVPLARAAAAAALVHGHAARLAGGGGPIGAHHLLPALPAAIADLLTRHRPHR